MIHHSIPLYAVVSLLSLWTLELVLADSPSQRVENNDESKIEEFISSRGLEVIDIKPSHVSGVYEVKTNTGAVMYFARGVDYSFAGELIRVVDGKVERLTNWGTNGDSPKSRILGQDVAEIPDQKDQKNDETKIKEMMSLLGLEMAGIRPSPVSEVTEVETDFGPFVYFVNGSEYAFVGELMIILNGKFDNLSQIRRYEKRRSVLKEVDPDSSLVFTPSGKVEHVVYVFTDVDDESCRRFHANLDSYLAEGIEIRYLAYPQSGIQSNTYDKMVSVWCSQAPKAAFSKSIRGNRIKKAECSNPMASHINLGLKMNVTRIPGTVVETGGLISGYKTPAALKNAINRHLQLFKQRNEWGLIQRSQNNL